MIISPLIDQLITRLRCLPGVGPKSAQRMAFHLLQHDRENANALAQTLQLATKNVGHCQLCRSLSEDNLCRICSNPKRINTTLCVVESPADILAIEQTHTYQGIYFVLMGHLSPIDGIGPKDLGLDQFQQRLKANPPEEIILATNPTVEGEATAHYICELVKSLQIKITRIAHGVPLGGELEYVDGGTLAHAIMGREEIIVRD